MERYDAQVSCDVCDTGDGSDASCVRPRWQVVRRHTSRQQVDLILHRDERASNEASNA